jgi:hypothetical protein
MLPIFSTDILPAMFTAVALNSYIRRLPITQNSQLRIYSDVQQQITTLRNVIKFSHNILFNNRITYNTRTCPSVLRDFPETHKSREFSVIYYIYITLFYCLTSS